MHMDKPHCYSLLLAAAVATAAASLPRPLLLLQTLTSTSTSPLHALKTTWTRAHTHIYTQVPTLDTIEKEIRGGLPPTLPKTGQAREALAQSLPPAAEILSQASSRPVIETVMDLPPAKSSAPKRKRRTSSTTGWVVAYDFPFEKRALKGLSFGKELWMMMTAFGGFCISSKERGDVGCCHDGWDIPAQFPLATQ